MNSPAAQPLPWWKRPLLRRGTAAIVTVILLICLYHSADWQQVLAALRRLHPGYLAAAMFLFVPQTVASAWRWQALVAPVCRISLRAALRQTLAASALNLAVPSKLGDLSKAAMLPVLPRERLGLAARVTAEKLSDVIALAALLAAGWLGMGSSALACALAAIWVVHALVIRVPRIPLAWWSLVPGSLTLWCLHLAQLHLFLLAAGVPVSPAETLARVPLAIFAGLVPVALMGIGTRDAALVWLFADVAPASTMAAVGLLTALRYLVPGAAGIPLLAGVWPRRHAEPPLKTAALAKTPAFR